MDGSNGRPLRGLVNFQAESIDRRQHDGPTYKTSTGALIQSISCAEDLLRNIQGTFAARKLKHISPGEAIERLNRAKRHLCRYFLTDLEAAAEIRGIDATPLIALRRPLKLANVHSAGVVLHRLWTIANLELEEVQLSETVGNVGIGESLVHRQRRLNAILLQRAMYIEMAQFPGLNEDESEVLREILRDVLNGGEAPITAETITEREDFSRSVDVAHRLGVLRFNDVDGRGRYVVDWSMLAKLKEPPTANAVSTNGGKAVVEETAKRHTAAKTPPSWAKSLEPKPGIEYSKPIALKDAKEKLGVSHDTLLQMLREQTIDYVYVSPRKIRIGMQHYKPNVS